MNANLQPVQDAARRPQTPPVKTASTPPTPPPQSPAPTPPAPPVAATSIREKLLTALDAACAEFDPLVPNRAATTTIRAILDSEKIGSPVTPAEREAIARLQGAWEEVAAALRQCGHDVPRQLLREQQRLLRLDPVGYRERLRSLSSFEEECRLRRHELKAKKRQIAAAAHELIRPAWQRIGDTATAFAKKRQVAEQAEAAAYGVPFHPSPILRAAWALAVQPTTYVDAISLASPRDQSAGLLKLDNEPSNLNNPKNQES